jgi:hypothetical protein
MIVKGMEQSVFIRIIPLPNIPLTSLQAFPSSVLPVVSAGRAGRDNQKSILLRIA